MSKLRILRPRIYDFWDWLDCKLADLMVWMSRDGFLRWAKRKQQAIDRLGQYTALPDGKIRTWLVKREMRYLTHCQRRIDQSIAMHRDALMKRRETINRLLPRSKKDVFPNQTEEQRTTNAKRN